ncbi:MAG: hypothetical protein QOG16_86, partial [Actinomycetota bacterium]|nr:hypothetical protein [Actinomycetota bacterium]
EKYLYVGTGQPSSPTKEHQHTNAILKIDIDRSRSTFGDIIDAYKGIPETYVPGLQNQPVCQQFGDDTPAAGACLNQDIDFGASPNLFRDERGNLMVGEYQKAGVYHAVYADTMQQAWTAILSPLLGPAYLANAASTAYDGKHILGVGSFPGQMFGLNKTTGGYDWVAPVADGVQYNPISTANGVAYTTDTKGFLDAFDAATGTPLMARPMGADAGEACANLAGGSAIARNTVYAICDTGSAGGGWIIAYTVPK